MGSSGEEIIALASRVLTDWNQEFVRKVIARYFERIGDRCTNIAEWVEFSVTGIHKDCQ